VSEGGEPASLEPFFLHGTAGQLLSVYFNPSFSLRPSIGVLYIPPFADEMNKSRRQAALMAGRLASKGLGTLMVDLYGTGDAEGNFVDARWEIWTEDLLAGISWLKERGMQRIVLWGVRFGALLGADLYHRFPRDIERLVMWQPVVSGKTYVSQFLRLRAAAEMISGAGGLDTRSLHAALGRGETLEIAGYELHPDLARDIQRRDLRELPLDPNAHIEWLEVVSDSNYSLSPVAMKLIESWRASGAKVHAEKVIGEHFWAAPEITVVNGLLETDPFLAQASRG